MDGSGCFSDGGETVAKTIVRRRMFTLFSPFAIKGIGPQLSLGCYGSGRPKSLRVRFSTICSAVNNNYRLFILSIRNGDWR